MENSYKIIAGLAVVAILSLAINAFRDVENTADNPLGSVQQSSEYQASSTTENMAVASPVVLKSDDASVLGSIVVASSSAGIITVYNATSTTDTASTTFVSLSSNLTPNTYTFDAIIPRGLIIELGTGFDGEYVITYR